MTVLYRDAVRRVSIVQIRAQFPPRVFRSLDSVTLTSDGVAEVIALVTQSAVGCLRGERRFLRCPRCAGSVNVLGFVDGVGWACSRCAGWRSRNRRHVAADSC